MTPETLATITFFTVMRLMDSRDMTPKAITIFGMILITFYYFESFNLLIIASYFILFTPPWGTYLTSINGNYKPEEERKCIGWIDYIYHLTYRITKNNYLPGIVGMSLRWTAFAIPLFATLWMFEGINPIRIMGLLGIGFAYYLGGLIGRIFKRETPAPELLSAGLLGCLIFN